MVAIFSKKAARIFWLVAATFFQGLGTLGLLDYFNHYQRDYYKKILVAIIGLGLKKIPDNKNPAF